MFGEATGQLAATTAVHTASSQVAQHQTYGYDLVGKLLSRAWKATPGNAATTDVTGGNGDSSAS